jgi:hypothetical protein
MPIPKRRHHLGTVVAVALAGCGLVLVGGCKSSTSPETVAQSITVQNSCGATIEVFLDGTLELTVEAATSGTLSDISVGSHLIEARKEETEIILYSETLDFVAGQTYSITIEGQASMRITNDTADILSIYVDSAFLGDIGPGLSQVVHRVSFGEYSLEAKKRSDGTSVATTTIEVTDIMEYDWTITPGD